jgi:hypothetical protein
MFVEMPKWLYGVGLAQFWYRGGRWLTMGEWVRGSGAGMTNRFPGSARAGRGEEQAKTCMRRAASCHDVDLLSVFLRAFFFGQSCLLHARVTGCAAFCASYVRVDSRRRIEFLSDS